MRSGKLWLFLLMVMVSVLIMACARATPTPAPTPVAAPTATPAPTPTPALTPAATATPAARKPEGTLVMAVTGILVPSGIPSRAPLGFLQLFSGETLIRYGPKGEFIPNLAERWELSPDAKTLTFYLRKGIQFHDGWGEMTAEDVKFSLEDAKKEGSVNTRFGPLRKYIKDIRVTNPYQLEIELGPGGALDLVNQLLQAPIPAVGVVSKKYVESVGEQKAAEHPIGTGAWKFVERKEADYIKYEAVGNHYRQPPYFKTLIVREVPEEGARIAMLRTGEVDMAEISLAFKAEAEKGGLKTLTPRGGRFAWVIMGGLYLPTREGFDLTLPWVGDPKDSASTERALKVRKAMALAVNRQEIIKTILAGLGEEVAISGFAPGTVFPDPGWKPYPYDPAEAKRLFAEAGYPDGFKITMWLTSLAGRPWMPDVSEAVAMYWEKVGLKVSRGSGEYAASVRPQLVNRTFKGALAFGAGPYPQPLSFYTATMHSTADALLGPEDTRIDEMIGAISNELDSNKRLVLERQLGEYVHNAYLEIPVATVPWLIAVGGKVGAFPMALGQGYFTDTEYITPAGR